MLEFELVDEYDYSSFNHKVYRLLDDIELSVFKSDQEKELPFDDEEEPF